jgi:hypothetical protein
MAHSTSATMPPSAFKLLDAHAVEASELTRGPWNKDQQHAGPALAVACRAIENAARNDGFGHIARLTANLLRPLPIGKLEIQVAADYVGRNAGHYAATLRAEGKDLARFTALAQKEQDLSLPALLDGHPLPQAPTPPAESSPDRMPFGRELTGYADLVETRSARGKMFRGRSAIWFRLRYPLVDGEEPSPYQRVVVAADSTNGISAVLDLADYTFVNADITINLLRRPVGEWVCLDARTLLAPNGCGLAEAEIFDEAGLTGRVTQSLAVRATGQR